MLHIRSPSVNYNLAPNVAQFILSNNSVLSDKSMDSSDQLNNRFGTKVVSSYLNLDNLVRLNGISRAFIFGMIFSIVRYKRMFSFYVVILLLHCSVLEIFCY